MDELIKLFDLHRCTKSGAKFDYTKGLWFNHQYIQQKPNEEIAELFLPFLKEHGVEAPFEKVVTVVGMMKDRVSFIKELWDVCSFFFVAPTEYDEKTVKKRWKEDSAKCMTELAEVIAGIEDFSIEGQEKVVMDWIAEKGYHTGNITVSYTHLAKTLLGTATPSIETWQNATDGKYGFVQLKERYKEIQLPEIIPVDIKELHRKKRMVGQFSPLLVQYMKEALEQKEQVILFQNRRGFAPMIECRTCGWVPKCKNCDVSLTYHKGINQLTCHYCGYTYQLPKACPACEGTELVNRGFGTEKIEDDIKILFPEAAVARMDLDTTRTRSAYEKIIADFEQGKTDILIGTQMVSKGLDFDHVSIVGILNADTMLNYPDFRSYERAFQLMAQVAGRAGRKNKRGRVILQTKSIDHPIIHQVIANDYEDMVGGQLAERQMFHYPPYYRLVYVYLKNHNESLLDQMAAVMAGKLRAVFGNRVLGPDKPPVARIQTLFIKKIVVKIEQNAPMGRARELLLRIQREMIEDERYKSLIVYYDVDPM